MVAGSGYLLGDLRKPSSVGPANIVAILMEINGPVSETRHCTYLLEIGDVQDSVSIESDCSAVGKCKLV
jgi:hypothetical protein